MKNVISAMSVAAVSIMLTHDNAFASERVHEYAPAVRADVVIRADTNSVGQRIRYPQSAHPQVTMLHVVIPPGENTGWHRHPVPGFAYVVSGTLRVRTEHGSRIFHQGQGFAESVNVLHTGENIGNVPVDMVVTFLGTRGKPIVIRAKSTK